MTIRTDIEDYLTIFMKGFRGDFIVDVGITILRNPFFEKILIPLIF